WSKPAKWSMGLIEKSDWKAKWIGIKTSGPENEDTDVQEIESRGNPPITPSPMLRKSFRMDNEIERAFVYATALGLYELYINGNKAGNRILAPEWTDYTKRVQYQTYDVTDMLKTGENVIGVILADGWYIGTFGQWGDDALRGKNYGSLDRKFLLRMDIITDEGKLISVLSDETWKGFSDGPIRSADMFLGEIVDARKAVPGWDQPGFTESGWTAVEVYPDPGIDLVAQMNEPIRIIENLKPVSVTEPDPGVFIFNIGQNMVGWCRLLTDEPEGTIITLRHGEMLDEEGRLYHENLRRAKQEDIFITSGKGSDTFEPRFTYHGFQYVEVTGLTRKPDTDMLTGIAFSSDAEPSGSFECSNTELNRLWKNILWTQRDNQHSIPTDCPQRDERMGWMGDALVFSQTAIFNMNMAAFYTKWCRDIRDAQSDDGRFADFAPHPNWDKPHLNAPGWADAGLVVPWRVYQNYGDINILRDQYTAAKRFIDYVHNENPDLIWIEGTGNNYGDWLNGDRIKSEDYPEKGAEMPKDAFATAYFAYSTGILAQMAKLLGNEPDHRIYSALADSIRNVFITEFVTEEGIVAGDNQAAYAIALDFGLLPDTLRSRAVRNMLRALEDYDGRISTGFHSTILLMKELTDWGYTTVAYDLLESHRFPSWLYSIDQGATTIWERWDAYVKGRGFQDIGMNSFNHYSFGSVAEWMYRTILGINPDKQIPGFKKFIMKPEPGGSLTWAAGEYNSIHGKILSEWKIENDQFIFTVSVPVNTSAVIHIPSDFPESITEGDMEAANSPGVKLLEISENEGIFEVQSGTYHFKSEIQFQQNNEM
ncbi:MAG: glycoside hydrolase family 78 protein, partial [Bacteroidales bacterium]